MMAALLQTLFITISFTALSIGIEMSGCRENRLEMVENSQNYNVTCTNIGGTGRTVEWDRATGLSAGICTAPNSCTSTLPVFAVVSRPTYSTSIMTVKSATRQLFGNRVVKCYTSLPTNPGVVRSEDSCTVDVVVPAVLSAGSVEVVKTNPSWTLRANTTITTVYSSQGQYNCTWYADPQSGASVGSDTSLTLSPDASDTSDLSNRTGWCSSSWTMPLTTDTYCYVVLASPGGTRQSAGSVNITRPASPSLRRACPGDYVPELSPVTCPCYTSSLGSPPGVIGWSHDMSSSVLTLPNVTRSDHNTNFTCNVQWSSLTQHTTLNVKVAYGPDPGTTTISSADVTNGVFDTDGSRDLHLTCITPDSAVNPAPSYNWTQPAGCIGQGQGSCTFRPQPPQNVTVTCRVANQKNSGSVQTVDKTIILNYPPTQSPVITGYNTGYVLYMNDPLSLTCDVTGGYPEVSRVTLKCDNRTLNVTPGQQGRLNVASLTASDHQANCTCSATWKVTSLYTRTGSVSLTVHSPPSAPSISLVSPAQFPYMEGDTPTLTCSSSDPGVPQANYTWSGHRTQDNVVTSPGVSQLKMAPLTRHDNHRNIVCNASNDYTQHRGDVTPTNHNITVYYLPIFNLTSSANNNCTFRRDLDHGQRSCVVPEGQPIGVQCSAVSNPEVASITWTSPAGLTNGQGGNGQLVIPSADRLAHNTEFNCTATTGNTPPDSRLPLTNSTSLRVYVAYPSSLKALELNNVATNLTVNESDVTSVSLTCRSDGRPTPRMQLVRKHDGTVLKTVTGGSYTDVDDDTVVDHVISPARCEDTGTYMCVSDNQLGPEERQTLSLFVNCVPRRSDPPPLDPLTVNYEGRPIQLSVDMVAFPLPDTFTFVFHGPANNMSESVTPGKLDSRCWNAFPAYRVTCNVTVNDITSRDAGVYSLKIGNSFGHLNIVFEVAYFGTDPDGSNNSIPRAVIGGAIAATIAVFVLIAVIILFVRRKQNGKRKEERPLHIHSEDATNEDTPEMIDNVMYESSGSKDEVMIVNEIYGTSGHRKDACSSGQQTNPYEDVDVTKVKPCILPKPKTNIPPPSASPSPAGNSNVYAVVKKKTTSEQSSMANSGSAEEISNQGGKSKSGKKSKDETAKSNGKGKQKAKAKGDKRPLHPAETPGSVYSNMTPLSMSPLQGEGTVYENYAFNKDEVDGNETDKNRAEKQSEMVNPDGLVYTTIAFSTDQQRKAEQPPPERETTEYADIDFTKRVAK